MGIVCGQSARPQFLQTCLYLGERFSEVPSPVLKLSEAPMSPATLPYRMEASARRRTSGPMQRVAGGMRALWGTGIQSCGLLARWCARHWFLPAPEYLEDAHGTTAAWARLAQGERGRPRFFPRFQFGWLLSEQVADAGDVGLSRCAGQQAVVPNAVEAIREDVQQEPADELGRSQLHDLLTVTAFDPVVLPAE